MKFGPLVVLALIGLGVFVMLQTKPEVERRKGPAGSGIVVDTQTLQPRDLQVRVGSYGRVQPFTGTQLVARVTGEIIDVSDAFRAGGAFKKNDVLLQLEQDDYQIALKQAESQVVEARSRLINEQALAQEARADWKRSGRQGEPPELALRKPQLRAAEAALGSAQASVDRARLNLERTTLVAPYDGRTLSANVDLGSVVSSGTALGQIFATDFAELTLPIKPKDLSLLPKPPYEPESVKVTVFSELSQASWEGYLVRMLPGLDQRSRQAAVVARIENPFDQLGQALMVDEYVTVSIDGHLLRSVITVPNTSIYQGTYVYVFREGKIFRQDVQIGWFDEHRSVIASGLNPGDELITTLLGQLVSGTPASKSSEPRKAGDKAR